MATLTVRNVAPEVHDFLRQRAARNGRSMEAEVRALLEERMQQNGRSPGAVARSIHERFRRLDAGRDLAQPARTPLPAPPDLQE